MSFEQRSYSGKLFRPRPEVYFDENEKLLIIATPWGQREPAKQAVQIIKDYLQGAKQDPEATTPFPRLPSLSDSANSLRIATLLVQDRLYSVINKEEFLCGLELFVATSDPHELLWIQAGYPQVLLLRKSKPCFPIISDLDLSVDLSTSKHLLPPLPEFFLGLEKNPPFKVNSVKRQDGDGLALLSRSWIPPELYAVLSDDVDLEEIGRLCSSEDAEVPFWTAIWRP